MILGVVSTDGVPTITLSIADQDWPAIIDTGFNGDLELPEDLREALSARHVGRVTSALAGGQIIEEDVYVVEIPFDGQIIHAEATFAPGSQILIGTHLCEHTSCRSTSFGKLFNSIVNHESWSSSSLASCRSLVSNPSVNQA